MQLCKIFEEECFDIKVKFWNKLFAENIWWYTMIGSRKKAAFIIIMHIIYLSRRKFEYFGIIRYYFLLHRYMSVIWSNLYVSVHICISFVPTETNACWYILGCNAKHCMYVLKINLNKGQKQTWRIIVSSGGKIKYDVEDMV